MRTRPLPPTRNPLAPERLARVRQELEEVAVAAELFGVSRDVFNLLTSYVTDTNDALVGDRREVARLQASFKRLIHNARIVGRGPGRVSRSLRALAAWVESVERLVQLGLGDVPTTWMVGPLELLNVYGHAEREVAHARSVLDDAFRSLKALHLDDAIATTARLAPAEVGSGAFMVYDQKHDLFVMDAKAASRGQLEVLEAVAHRIWEEWFDYPDVEVWGSGESGRRSFQTVFAQYVAGKAVSDDAAARLAVSVGRFKGAA